MKRETKEKIKGGLLRITHGIGEMLPSIAIGGGLGMIVGGYFGAIANSIQIKRLQRDVNRIDTNVNTIVKVHDGNMEKLNDFAHETIDQINELQRQNNVLLGQALEETKGKPA